MEQDLRPGEEFAGFRVRGRLGAGGMGAVYAADHPRLPRLVALKILTTDAGDVAASARFRREAETIARLDHPNIVSVLDRGTYRGRAWISMQLIDGQDCARAVGAEGPFAVERAATIARDVARALDAAHLAGVVHRDVKPANILLTRNGGDERAMLTDFGIASGGEQDQAITGVLGSSMATIAYAAPEQLAGRGAGARSDQYSLACTIFGLLTGHPPFQGSSVLTAQAHLNAPVPSVRAERPEIPVATDRALARAMAKDPAERFDHCSDFALALRPQAATGAAPESSERARWWPRVLIAGTAAAVAAGGVLVAGQVRSSGDSPSPIVGSSTSAASPTTTDTAAQAEQALWRQAAPALALWPQLLPSGPTSRGYQNMVCTPTDEATAATTVRFDYKLQCVSRPDGAGKDTVEVELLGYPAGDAAKALDALEPSQWVPVRTGAGRTVRLYHFTDPVEGTWVLVHNPDGERQDYHLQVSGEGLNYSDLYDWVAAAPI
ncbi:serine/threonine-protein kinase [Dermacoccaceae bacterium W4C1]